MRDHHVPQLPACLTTYNLISGGSTGWVLRLADGVALKYCVRERFKKFRTENDFYDTSLQRNPPPSIMQSFLRLPGINFMPLMASSLEERICFNQTRGDGNSPCVKVKCTEPATTIGQWATELARAIAWLESLGLVHGDLRPANILLDRDDHIKLADFDSVATMGSMNPGNCAPWARLRGCDGGEQAGSFGLYDAWSEQFAFASILYNLTTGTELYEEKGPEVLDLLRDLIFPELEETPLNLLTLRSWKGGFATLADLAMETKRLEGAEGAESGTRFDDGYMKKMKAQCQKLLDGKLAGIQFDGSSEQVDDGAGQ